MFPRQRGCPKCMFDEQEDVELATTGTLWTWTVQAFPPKAPPYRGPANYGVRFAARELWGPEAPAGRRSVSSGSVSRSNSMSPCLR